MLRTAAANWFELLTSREALVATLDCLAATGSVQLQAYSSSAMRLELPDLRTTLAEFETMSRRYAPLWPRPEPCAPDAAHDLLEAPRTALARLRAWGADAEPLVAELETVANQRTDARLLEALAREGGDALPRLDRLAAAGPMLAGRVYLLPADGSAQALPPAVLAQRVAGSDGVFLLAAGPVEDMAALDRGLVSRHARLVELPAGLPAGGPELAERLAARRADLDRREAAATAAIDALSARHELPAALGQLSLAAWLVSHVPELPVTEHFAWVTGWCSDPDDARLRAALDARGLDYLLRFTPAPEGCEAPTVLRNPRWARPFEVFAGLMGVPGTRDADPSMVVALIAPLMFGFMFGDVAQGLAVAAAGWVLRHRVPPLRLLLPGGVVAIGFGFAFGSVLGREDLLPALWVRPLEQPLLVLGTALAFGVVAITLGLALNALQCAWRGALGEWLAFDAGIALAYFGMVGTALDPRALWALPAGIAWAVAGPGLIAPRDRLGAAGHAAGEALERLLQVGVNTVSFVRVGAFALAHAGLCAAVVGMAEAAGPAYWPVLLLGNAAIVALEGLVVSIQTTRLILFEFFIRFLTARGRPFEPLAAHRPTPDTQPRTTP